nr:hypothetical protein [Escherichia coli]
MRYSPAHHSHHRARAGADMCKTTVSAAHIDVAGCPGSTLKPYAKIFAK